MPKLILLNPEFSKEEEIIFVDCEVEQPENNL
jgi:hypothetical protein